jgi:hypothetical protein
MVLKSEVLDAHNQAILLFLNKTFYDFIIGAAAASFLLPPSGAVGPF